MSYNKDWNIDLNGSHNEELEDLWFRWPWAPTTAAVERQTTGGTGVNPLVAGLVTLVAMLSLQLLQPLLGPVERPRLENHPMCGLTTGGQVIYHRTSR